jgi:hypothetical protein
LAAPDQIRTLINQLRNTPWADLEATLLNQLHRDNTGTTLNDGWPPGGAGGRATDVARPTETAAIARLDPTQRDELRGHLEHAVSYLQQAADSTAALTHRLAAAETLAQPEPRLDPAGTCNACGRWVPGTPDDRLRSGYCDADYRAWLRAGRPDRAAFERDRRQADGPDAA